MYSQNYILTQLCLCYNFRDKRARQYVTITNVAETLKKKEQYKNHEEFLKDCQGLPKRLRVFYYHEKLQPDGWDEQKDGRWPVDGVFIIRMRLPSANRSIKSRANDKRPVLLIASEPMEHLGLSGVL
jgi:hypothetical protein